MTSRFRYKRRIEFAETDMAGIVHFANYVRYMEEAEHAFFRSLGYSIHTAQDGRSAIVWPRLAVQCEYKKPLHFEEEIEIELIVAKRTNKTLRYHFDFYTKDQAGAAQVAATGSMTAVCARLDSATGQMHSIEIPREFERVEIDTKFQEG